MQSNEFPCIRLELVCVGRRQFFDSLVVFLGCTEKHCETNGCCVLRLLCGSFWYFEYLSDCTTATTLTMTPNSSGNSTITTLFIYVMRIMVPLETAAITKANVYTKCSAIGNEFRGFALADMSE